MLFNNHSINSARAIAAALLGFFILSAALAESNLASRSMNLEVIVKFSDDSDAGRRVRDILKDHPEDLSGLTELREQLHESTGFVLIPERVTSGSELIFRIPEKPLLETVNETVTRQPEVSRAELVAIQNENPRLPENLLLVHFRESGDATGLLEKAYGDSAYAGSVQELAMSLGADSGVPVLGTVQARGALAITVDRYALLEMLVAKLNDLDYVDYAQPNSTVQFMK